jgi:hypothetical protein
MEDAHDEFDENHIFHGPILGHVLEMALRDFDTQA